MSQVFNKWILTIAGAVLVGVCTPWVASAATINIILSDVDITYAGDAAGNTGSIFDVIAHNGGDLDPTESDVVETAVFERDMVHVDTEMTGGGTTLYADLKIDGAGTSAPKGSLNTVGSNGGTFGFDYFTSGGQNLRLGINTVDLLITNNTMFFTGTATVLSQNLPANLTFDPSQPISFSYTAALPGLVGNPNVTMAVASGALVIAGTAIPEPTTMVMLLGLVASAAATVRRRA